MVLEIAIAVVAVIYSVERGDWQAAGAFLGVCALRIIVAVSRRVADAPQIDIEAFRVYTAGDDSERSGSKGESDLARSGRRIGRSMIVLMLVWEGATLVIGKVLCHGPTWVVMVACVAVIPATLLVVWVRWHMRAATVSAGTSRVTSAATEEHGQAGDDDVDGGEGPNTA